MSDELITYVIGQLRGACWEEEAAAVEALVQERDEYKAAAAIWQEDFIQENQRLYVATVKLAIAVEALRNILSGDDLYPWRIAREVLAELEKRND